MPPPATATPEDLVAWEALILAQARYFQVAVRKHAFGIVVGTAAVPIPWTKGRIASWFIPSAIVYMGGDAGVVPDAGASDAGSPVAATQAQPFGPEEGDSPTYLIGTSAGIDVRCFELLPAGI